MKTFSHTIGVYRYNIYTYIVYVYIYFIFMNLNKKNFSLFHFPFFLAHFPTKYSEKDSDKLFTALFTFSLSENHPPLQVFWSCLKRLEEKLRWNWNRGQRLYSGVCIAYEGESVSPTPASSCFNLFWSCLKRLERRGAKHLHWLSLPSEH